MERALVSAALALAAASAAAAESPFACSRDPRQFGAAVEFATEWLHGDGANTGVPDHCVSLGDGKFLLTVNLMPTVQQGFYFADMRLPRTLTQLQGYGLAAILKELPGSKTERRFLVKTGTARHGWSCYRLHAKMPPAFENVRFADKPVKCP